MSKLRFEANGRATPAGKAVTKPPIIDSVPVTLIATAATWPTGPNTGNSSVLPPHVGMTNDCRESISRVGFDGMNSPSVVGADFDPVNQPVTSTISCPPPWLYTLKAGAP